MKVWNKHKKLQGELQHHWANGTYDEEWDESNISNTFLTANGLISENKEFEVDDADNIDGLDAFGGAGGNVTSNQAP